MKSNTSWLGLGLALLAAGCGDEVPATQALVVVHSDLEVGKALTSISAQVQTADGSKTVEEPFTFAVAGERAPGRHTLPLSFGIMRPVGGAERFRVIVRGYGPGANGSETLLVEQKALVTFQDRRTLRLPVFLGSVCAHKTCPSADEACYPEGESAIAAGACGPVKAPKLTQVDPGEELDGVTWPMGRPQTPNADGGTPAAPGPTPGADAGAADGGTSPDAWWSHFGIGYNESFQAGGVVAADLTLAADQVSGFINFSQYGGDPNPLCGAGVLMATRQGDNVTGSFVSDDPDQGCGFDKGGRVDLTGTLSADGSHFAGQYVAEAAPGAASQPGVFEMWRSPPDFTSCTGTFTYTNGVSAPLTLGILLGQRTVSGHWSTRDVSAGAICSQGLFAGIRKSTTAIEFSFVHGDMRPICGSMLGVRQFQTAELSADRRQLNGQFSTPNGTAGTFRVDCEQPL